MLLNLYKLYVISCPLNFYRVVRIRRAREANQEAVLLALCMKTFKKNVIIFRFVFRITFHFYIFLQFEDWGVRHSGLYSRTTTCSANRECDEDKLATTVVVEKIIWTHHILMHVMFLYLIQKIVVNLLMCI